MWVVTKGQYSPGGDSRFWLETGGIRASVCGIRCLPRNSRSVPEAGDSGTTAFLRLTERRPVVALSAFALGLPPRDSPLNSPLLVTPSGLEVVENGQDLVVGEGGAEWWHARRWDLDTVADEGNELLIGMVPGVTGRVVRRRLERPVVVWGPPIGVPC